MLQKFLRAAMAAFSLAVLAMPKPALAHGNTFHIAVFLGNATKVVPPLVLTLNQPVLASTVAWLIAVAAMIAVLVLRVLERRANSSWSAAFVVKDLEISPRELRAGNKASVAVTVNNRGKHAGTFKVILRVDGITKAEREVTLASGTSGRVEFSVPAAEPGRPIAVNVGGLSGTITVMPA